MAIASRPENNKEINSDAKIIVTGGAGFIGSNLVKALNQQGRRNILVVDNLQNGRKFVNLADCDIADFLDKNEFLSRVQRGESFGAVSAILHEGACSSTTEWNGQYMMTNNFEYSKQLCEYALTRKIPFLYASSAAVYGGNAVFKEEREFEAPLNVYGYSKMLFDHWLRNRWDDVLSSKTLVAGFRYFNVYGPRESHKGSMASVAYHFNQQIKTNGVCKLFAGTDGYADGEQLRDFVSVADLVRVKLWFLEQNSNVSGIYNLGTGKAQSFNAVADAVLSWHKKGKKEYVPFPEHLKGAYQSYTQADIRRLREAGYPHELLTVEQGVHAYLNELNA